MGFRSTFLTGSTRLDFPQWFYDKWKDAVNFNYFEKDNKYRLPISSKFEAKIYGLWSELIDDIQKAINEFQNDQIDSDYYIDFIYLHECGGITKIQIYKHKILYGEPEDWIEFDEVFHNNFSCVSCSDLSVSRNKINETLNEMKQKMDSALNSTSEFQNSRHEQLNKRLDILENLIINLFKKGINNA